MFRRIKERVAAKRAVNLKRAVVKAKGAQYQHLVQPKENNQYFNLEWVESNGTFCAKTDVKGPGLGKCDRDNRDQKLLVMDRASWESGFRLTSQKGYEGNHPPRYCIATSNEVASGVNTMRYSVDCQDDQNEYWHARDAGNERLRLESDRHPGYCLAAPKGGTFATKLNVLPCNRFETLWSEKHV